MKNKVVLIILILINISYGQDGLINSSFSTVDELINLDITGNGKEDKFGLKQEKWEFNDENFFGITIVGSYKDNIKNGDWIYYKNGYKTPWKTINYENGLINGYLTTYNKNGDIDSKVNFLNDKKNGESIYFENDVISYFKSHKLSRITTYKNDKIVKDILFSKNNSPLLELNYHYDEENQNSESNYYLQNLKIFHDNNKILTEGDFDQNSKKINNWNVYYPSGSLFISLNYIGNQYINQTGFYEQIDYLFLKLNNLGFFNVEELEGNSKTDKLYEFVNFMFNEDQDNKVGSWVFFYENGNIKDSLNYSNNGIQNGIQKKFYDNGILEEEGEFQSGKKIGKWKYFYSSGQSKGVTIHTKYHTELIKTFYENGKLEYYYDFNNSEIELEFYKNGSIKFLKKRIESNVELVEKEIEVIRKYYYDEDLKIQSIYSWVTNTKTNITTTKIEYYNSDGSIKEIERLGNWDEINENEFISFISQVLNEVNDVIKNQY